MISELFKGNKLQKFNIIFSLTLMIFLFFIANTDNLYSQQFKDVNFPDGSVAGMVKKNIEVHIYKIYQSAPNVIKFDLPSVNFVKIGLYDSKNNLVRTYIYNNLKEGTYEITLNSSNMDKGIYTCVLFSADAQESSQVIIE